MKRLNFNGEIYTFMNPAEEKLYKQLKRQFGKDASVFILSPDKYKHHFDKETLSAYKELNNENI